MNTTIEHKHPIGTRFVIRTNDVATVIGIAVYGNGEPAYVFDFMANVPVRDVDDNWAPIREPKCYLSVYTDEVYQDYTQEDADESKQADRIALLAVFDDGVEVIEGARGGGTGVAS